MKKYMGGGGGGRNGQARFSSEGKNWLGEISACYTGAKQNIQNQVCSTESGQSARLLLRIWPAYTPG